MRNVKQSPINGIRPNYNDLGVTISWKVDASHTLYERDENGNKKLGSNGKPIKKVVRETGTTKTYEEAVKLKQQLLNSIIYGTKVDKEIKKSWTLEEAKDNVVANIWGTSLSYKTSMINYHTCEQFFGAKRPLDEIDEDLIDEFKEHCKENQLSNSTINRKLSALSKCLTQAVRKRKLDSKPYIEFYKKAKSRKRIMSESEEKLFIDIANHWSLHEVTDFFIYLLQSGVRPWKEGVLTRKSDVDLKNNTIYIWQSKQGTERTIFMTKQLREVIIRRMKVTVKSSDPLFNMTKGSFIEYWHKIKGAMDLSADKTLVPYTLRHTCCPRLAKANLSLLKIKDWMGHKSILTTMEYAHLNTQSLIDCVNALEKNRLDIEVSSI